MNMSFEDKSSIPDNSSYASDDYYNESDYDDGCPKTEVIMFGKMVTPAIFLLITVFSCVGNTLVLWVLIKYENLRSLTNAFLLNLAISDLVFTFGLPFWSWDIVYGWIFGEILCKSVNFIFYLGYYSSVLFLMVLTMHRYIAVVHPWSTPLNSTIYNSVGISVLIWVMSCCAAVPNLIFSSVFKPHEEQGRYWCSFSSLNWKLFCIYQQNILFLIAFCTVAFCYTCILCRLLRHTVHTRPKTFKLIFCIAMTFYLGWAPYNVSMFLDSLIAWEISPFNECHVSTWVDYVHQISRLVAFSHCCLNPIFYVFMGIKFRAHLKKVLRNFCKTDKEPLDRHQSHMITSNGEEFSL